MDKYEFNIKVEQIKKLVNKGDYETAMKIADTIDWRRVRSANLLALVADIYENNKEYQEAKEILLLAFERAPIGKRLLYKLADLSLKENNLREAEDYYREFCDLAPGDPRQHLLRYQILKAKKAPDEQLIYSLERYTNTELDEKWLYELAELYCKSGKEEECVRTCDKIMLMFGLGKFVDKAMQLKVQYAPLSDYQMDLIENRDKYEEKLRAVEQEFGDETRAIMRDRYEDEAEDTKHRRAEISYSKLQPDIGIEPEPEPEYMRQTKPVVVLDETAMTSDLADEMEASIHQAEMEEQLAREVSKISIEEYNRPEAPMEQTKIIGSIHEMLSAGPPNGRLYGKEAIRQFVPKEHAAEKKADYLHAEVSIDAPTEVLSEAAAEEMSEAMSEVPSEVLLEVPPEMLSEVPPEMLSEVPPEMLSEVRPEMLSEVRPEMLSEVPTVVLTEGPSEVPSEVLNDKSSEVLIRAAAQASPDVLDDKPAGREKDIRLMIEARTPDKGLELAVEVLKRFHKEKDIKCPVIKITGSKLSSKGVAKSADKLINKDLVIEEAGDLTAAALTELQDLIENLEIRVIMIDNPRQIESMVQANPALAALFTVITLTEDRELEIRQPEMMEKAGRENIPVAGKTAEGEAVKEKPSVKASEEAGIQAEIMKLADEEAAAALAGGIPDMPVAGTEDPVGKRAVRSLSQPVEQPAYNSSLSRSEGEMEVHDFVEYTCKYASDIDCSITGKSMLALYERIEIMEENGIPLTKINAENLIEEAADQAEKFSFKKLFTGLFHPRYDKEGLLILREEHFMS